MTELAAHIDTIERGYEYLLAYAAQGRRDDSGSEVRTTLTAMHAALEAFANAPLDAYLGVAEAEAHAAAAFLKAVTEDARKAQGAIALVLSRLTISSLLVDNLNASIHLRALLTDLFLIEQALKS
jgi:hypothetical protein